MMELHAQSWYTVTGRGKVASINREQLPPGPPDGRDLLNQEVMIDGEHYIVSGVESCRVMHHNQTERCSMGYGLLVKEKP